MAYQAKHEKWRNSGSDIRRINIMGSGEHGIRKMANSGVTQQHGAGGSAGAARRKSRRQAAAAAIISGEQSIGGVTAKTLARTKK